MHGTTACIKSTEQVTTSAAGGLVHRASKRDGFFIYENMLSVTLLFLAKNV